MKALSTLKDHSKENQLYLNRAIVASLVVFGLMLILFLRIAYFQILQHHRYTTLSQNNQLKITPIPPIRGLIYDRRGRLLASNIPAFSLEMTPNKLEDLCETIEALKKIIPITEAQEQTFYKQLRYKRRTESIPVRLKLTELEIAAFSLKKHLFPGVEVVAHPVRYYPSSDLLAHVLGYLGPMNETDLAQIDKIQYRGTYHIGKTGLEKFYESILHGQAGYQQAETDAHGQIVRVQSRSLPIPGKHLIISIDLNLQTAATKALGSLKGAVIALDPHNGDILAMVSSPSFDPNLFTQGIDTDTFDQLQFSTDRPLFNRIVNGLYPPGSTVKPAVGLQGLALKFITPNTTIFDPGWFQLTENGRRYRDWNWQTGGHGYVNLEKAIAQSCDTYFFTLSNHMGPQALIDIYRYFGLGQKTGIDFPNESQGLLPSPAWKQQTKKEAWYAGDTINIGIGQGFLQSTPLQIVQMASFIANRGVAVIPRLKIAEVDTPEMSNSGSLPPAMPVLVHSRIQPSNISKEQWEHIIEGMRKTIATVGGSGHKIHAGLTYPLAGKTGTSQVFNLKADQKYEAHKIKASLRDHSWFMGFAPIQQPQIAIAVLVENKFQRSAVEVAREVLDHFFQAQGNSNS